MAISQNIVVRFSADIAQAMAAWKQMARAPEEVQRKAKAGLSATAKGARSANRELASMAKRWLSVGAGVAAATQALKAYQAAEMQQRQERTTTTVKASEMRSRYARQLGVDMYGPEEVTANVHSRMLARKYAAHSVETVSETGRFMKSYNWVNEQIIEGGALEQMEKFKVAAVAQGGSVEDAQSIAKSITTLMQGSKTPLTIKNLKEVTEGIVNLWQSKAIEVADFERAAQEAASLKTVGEYDIGTQITQLTALKTFAGKGTAEAVLASRQTVMKLGALTPARRKALSKMGITAEEIDWHKHTHTEVKRVLARSMERFEKADKMQEFQESLMKPNTKMYKP